jgi:hypothetical protein
LAGESELVFVKEQEGAQGKGEDIFGFLKEGARHIPIIAAS